MDQRGVLAPLPQSAEARARLRNWLVQIYAVCDGELYYDTRYDIWNRNEYSFGTEIPVRRHTIIEFYYIRQNTSQSSTPHLNAFGLVFQWHL